MQETTVRPAELAGGFSTLDLVIIVVLVVAGVLATVITYVSLLAEVRGLRNEVLAAVPRDGNDGGAR
jgi:hypothetical protein